MSLFTENEKTIIKLLRICSNRRVFIMIINNYFQLKKVLNINKNLKS